MYTATVFQQKFLRVHACHVDTVYVPILMIFRSPFMRAMCQDECTDVSELNSKAAVTEKLPRKCVLSHKK